MREFSHEGLCCDLLVFDLDGTLIDSQQDLANSVNATLGYLGRSQLSHADIAGFIGDGAQTLLRRALEATGDQQDTSLSQALTFFLQYYRAHKLDYTRCYPGVLDALREIRNAAPNLPMAVLTNKPQGPARAICDGLGLSEFFFANYGGDSFQDKKPHPAGMQALVDEASLLSGVPVLATRTVLIGDSHVDVETARNAGARSIGCLYGLAPVTLRAAGPDVLVDHPAEWLGSIHRLMLDTSLSVR